MAFDKITAIGAPPGNSLTDEPGRWPWEQPPVYSNPDDAVDYVVDQLDNEKSRDGVLKLLMAGITVEELVNQISFKGFMNGYYTPDVAELIKPAVGLYIYHLALEEGIEPEMFNEKDEEEQVSDEAFFRIMKVRNPEMFEAMNEELNRQTRLQGYKESLRKEMDERQQTVAQTSFLGMGE